MTRILASTKTEFAIDPAILALLPAQGCIELQRDAAGKVHHFHTHPVDEILVIISGELNFKWEDGERICRAGDTIFLPAGTLHQSEALDGGAVYAIATRPPAATAIATRLTNVMTAEDQAQMTDPQPEARRVR
jgi:mannose-6-phosphate isomerase-like protein (cupin superfamily)